MINDVKKKFSILLFEGKDSEAGLARELEASGVAEDVIIVGRLGECLKQLRQNEYDIVLVNAGYTEEEAMEAVDALSPALNKEVLIMGGYESTEFGENLLKAGAHDVISRSEWIAPVISRVLSFNQERLTLRQALDAQKNELPQDESEERLKAVFDSITDALIVLDEDYIIHFLNNSAANLLDSTKDSLTGEVFPFSLDTSDLEQLEIEGPDGVNRLYQLEVTDFTWRNARSHVVILKDVTLGEDSEHALLREDVQLNVLMESVFSGILIVNAEGKVERMNSMAEELIGVAKKLSLGLALEKVLWVSHPKTGRRVNNLEEVFLGEDYLAKSSVDEVELTRRDGEVVGVRLRMSRMDAGYIVVIYRKGAESGGTQDLEKLNTIGLLASGIGHDFNNILSAVLGNISVARIGIDKSHPISRHLILAEKAALQAKSLTHQLISFAKGGLPNLEATSLVALVEDCSQFILRGSNVKCVTKVPDDLWAAVVDAGQISQVINNLIINADQAMPKGGALTVSLRNATISVGQIMEVPAGEYVVLSIKDEGVGISPEDQKRIFDPYFSTKEEGSGLGLVSTKSIVEAHKGFIKVKSKPGEGTEFEVYLPRSFSEIPEGSDTGSESEPEFDIEHKGGRILVMDDMEGMMLVAGEILKTLGYEVGYSTNGQEAIDAYKAAKEAGNPYNAVVFDLTVPGGMGGEEACGILLKYDPKLIAIASSGYTNSNVMEDFESAGFKAVVPKPYRIKEMSVALSRILREADQE